MTTKRMTIGHLYYESRYQTTEQRAVPFIRIRGRWLKRLGYRIGERIVVEAHGNQLIISRQEGTR